MKKYSWKWFGEMLWGKKEEESIKEAIDKFNDVLQQGSQDKADETAIKPYKSAKLVGTTAIFVLQSGATLEKLDCTLSEWDALLLCKTEGEMISLVSIHTRKGEPVSDVLIPKENWRILEQVRDFEIKDNSVYLKGIGRSIPILLVNKFTEIAERVEKAANVIPENATQWSYLLEGDEEYISLKNFWYWLCLNPFPQVINSLYDFLEKGDFKITKDGMFLAYRRVCKVNQKVDSSLVEFISNSYVKIKGWKKSPKNFWVWGRDNGDFELSKESGTSGIETNFGNLAELYQNLDTMEENRYTDNRTRTFDIRIGKIVSMPREECIKSNADCGKGRLHFANSGYDYYSFGDTGILMLVNPMNVVGTGDVKGGTSEYLPLCTIPLDEERSILSEMDFNTFELQEYYAEEQLKELEERVKSNYITEAEKDIYSIEPLKKEEVKTIIHNLQEIVKRKINPINN